jgi:general secretion pathway protein M
MNRALSPAVSRALAIAILVAIVALIFSSVIAPLWDTYSKAHSETERLASALARANGAEPSLPVLRAELAELNKGHRSTVGFLPAANESLAAAELQGKLKAAVDTVRGELRSVQTLPAKDEGSFRRISISGQIAVTLPALQRVLYGLETATPLLFLDNIDIRARPVRPGYETTEEPMLDVRFDVSAYMQRPS